MGQAMRSNLKACRIPGFLVLALACLVQEALASSLRISLGSTRLTNVEVEADYTTTHVYIDEVAHQTQPITVFFDPQMLGVESAEVFTNLNRRERATLDANSDGIEDGIMPPPGNSIAVGDDSNYYKAYRMTAVSGGYLLTLVASKCGAYRLTARFRLSSDAAGKYRWYGDELNAQGIPKRDHALVISPQAARDLRLYEVNPLTILATGVGPGQRGSLTELAAGLPAGSGPRFSLAYLGALGVNAIWLQPVHPRGIAGREIDPSTRQPFELGSPYAVKNYFAVMPLLAKSTAPSPVAALDDTAAGRVSAMRDFQAFVTRADTAGIDIVLDVPFNHGAPDVELAPSGQQYWGNATTGPTAEVRSVEARVFSRVNAYDMRAANAAGIAPAPDRYDFGRPPEFGKWLDVSDFYFGRYAALVPNQSQQQQYQNEGDWFDYSVGNEDAQGTGNGHFDRITQNLWRYFGDYLQFWLTQSGYPANEAGLALDSKAGIDGLRADFGQGLPPQCWEYLINRTRARKWNFVFLAETIDGGTVGYRSARHFDILNEHLVSDLHRAVTAAQFRALFDSRRSSYGDVLILLNTASHDEDTYKDPYQALMRFAVLSTMAGVPMIFPGQELGMRGTVIPPNDTNTAAGPPFGYERYAEPSFGKPVPAFEAYNSMMPLWVQGPGGGEVSYLTNLYAAVNTARAQSAALRSGHYVFLDAKDGSQPEQVFAVGKVATPNADARNNDVIFAFVNLAPATSVQLSGQKAFDVRVDADRDGRNDFGINPDRLYNLRNLAAYTGADASRAKEWTWSTPRRGSDLLSTGIAVTLNRLPSQAGEWATAPYEPLYLKLFDVTPAP
jgi:hypothetical protein